jgi:hypothetical protein
MKKTLIVCLALAFAGPALAQHVHQKGPNGGPLEDVAGVHLEMVVSGRNIKFNVFDDAEKAMSSKGITATALLASGSERETLALAEDGNALKGEAKKDITPGTTVSVTLKTAAGKSGQAKFKK